MDIRMSVEQWSSTLCLGEDTPLALVEIKGVLFDGTKRCLWVFEFIHNIEVVGDVIGE